MTFSSQKGLLISPVKNCVLEAVTIESNCAFHTFAYKIFRLSKHCVSLLSFPSCWDRASYTISYLGAKRSIETTFQKNGHLFDEKKTVLFFLMLPSMADLGHHFLGSARSSSNHCAGFNVFSVPHIRLMKTISWKRLSFLWKNFFGLVFS